MSLWKGVKSVFGFDGVGESALRIVDRIAGTDWTPEQRAKFVLDHAAATKYQSPTRRVIATIYVVEWAIMINLWMAASAYGRYYDAPNAILLASDVSAFMSGNISVAMNGILAFYFLIGVKK